MNIQRIFLAAVGGFIVYFVFGGLSFAVSSMRNEFKKYPAVYRSAEGIKRVMPAGMAAMFIAMLALTLLYAILYQGRSGMLEGARFGALIAIFSVCSFVIHNYVNLNIGIRITIQQSIAYSVEWLLVGVAIGLIYKPL
jgi:hypothetical protein